MESIEPNNFERQVKDKMDELIIHPSESAWPTIAKRISGKGKRRKILYLIFLLALILLTGGYWVFNYGKNLKTIANNPLQHVIQKDTQKIKIIKKDSSLAHSAFSGEQSINDVEPKVPEGKVGISGKIVKFKKPKDSGNLYNAPFVLSNKNRIASEVESKEMPSAEVSIPEEKSRDSADDQKKTLAKNDFEIRNEFEKYSPEITGQDTVKNNAEKGKIINKPESALANSKMKSPAIKNRKGRWQAGFNFSGGISSIGNDPFGLNNNSQSFLSPTNTGSGTGTISYSTPSRIRNSIAFNGGVFIEKNIYQKARFSIGINYKYFSTLNKTGDQIVSGQTSAYAAGNSRTYRNNFNFIELPVSLKTVLNKNKLLPIYWQAGMSISQLISSNALQFKTVPGEYYPDNSLFNKTLLGFSTGLYMTLFVKQKYPVSVGPYFYYGASGIAHDGLYKKKHFSYIGISTEILLQKK